MSNNDPTWLSDPELTSLRTDVFRSVGKSIYLYQEIERRIKFLNVVLDLEMKGPQSEWPAQLAMKQENLSTKSMGILMRSLLEKLYFSENQLDAQSDTPSEENVLKMRWRFCLQTTAEYVQQRKATIDTFVLDRNRLVHHYFEKINFADGQMLKQMSEEIEAQHVTINDEINHLNQIVQLINESFQSESAWWESEEGTRQWEIIKLQSSIPINFLEHYSFRTPEVNGWTIFQTATAELKKQYPLEVEHFFNKFSFKSLQAAAIASQLFDFMEEKTVKGQRTLYKLKATDYEYTTTVHP